MLNRFTARRDRSTGRSAFASAARPAMVVAAAAAMSFGVIAPAQAHTGSHTVSPGDTLSKLAASHGTTWQGIHAANRDTIGSNPNVLRVGQVLSIGGGSAAAPAAAPAAASGSYVVRAGDTLSKIAAAHGTTWQSIYSANRDTIGSNPNVLRIGQRLTLGGGAAAPAAPAPSRPVQQAASRSADRSTSGDPRSIARTMVAERGWGAGEFACLDSLWEKESNWNPLADNPNSSAYGIPQALPGSKMASAGPDWRTNPATQITWGLGYISDRYGTPCAAWAHSQANNWY
ncbi:LysM peptidoglycan-binding domain-containing protein [Modestobacter sp. VKM Ac-2977]|uniref:LysM peptidoglycan-binding domain-containing protein n=1 Tax=Modestobacter sp. VKM Ac-2977 TaxID=3004131 RepID=UPI0022AABFBF|nr:LysM peptidoglycan-binding domain-containing protein [Modestobacter sp. VKM Ac-2977]MCZ2822607.1 LysM peptidoglycan-binding domain-containing protein [Modestobacter sp. VKM Ac-2977]